MHISISVSVLIGLLAAALIVGVFIGWNNGKSSVVAKLEAEEKNLTGDAAKAIANVKAKL